MKRLEFIQNPYSRIKIAHVMAFLLLLVNALYFTDNGTSMAIQLVIAIVIILHHLDDEIIKKTLINSQEILKANADIYDRNIIVSETDLNGVITYVNDNFLKLTGYERDELINFTHAKIKCDNTRKEVYTELWEIITNNKTFASILQNKKKDGSSFWVDIHITPIISNGNKIGYKSIMFDITDKILAQEDLQHAIEDKDIKLQEQATKFEFAINSSRDGFWDYDLVKNEFYLSKGWKKRLGFTDGKKLKYLDYLSLMPNEHRFDHHKSMHDLIEQYPNDVEYIHFRIVYPLVTKDGEKLNIEDVGDIFFDNQQNPIRITGFHRDITEQERQSKIIESQNRLNAMGEMMSNVAHQWRQPIGAINNTLNDVELDIELDDITSIDTKTFLKTSTKIKELTAYLSQTIDDFKNLTSDDKVKTHFMVNHTVNQAYNISKNEYEKNNINFHILESGTGVCEMEGYDRELQQVIINLLNNAKDILIEKKIQNPKVLLSIVTTDTDISIIIHDNGGGVPQNIIPKIFDPYFTTKHESIGTGIGLYMSRKIITEYFKGTLEVENENDGAKFSINLKKELDID